MQTQNGNRWPVLVTTDKIFKTPSYCTSFLKRVPFLPHGGTSPIKQNSVGEQPKCSKVQWINNPLKIEARIMSVYLSPLPVSTNEQAHSRAYRILLYIRELSPADRSFSLNRKFCSKKKRSAHITSSCNEFLNAHTATENCTIYNRQALKPRSTRIKACPSKTHF